MRTLAVIPTYCEADNISDVLGRLRASAPDVDILVVDDSSPDGTGAVAEQEAGRLGRIDVLERPAKAGLGTAYRAGFAWAIDRGYDVLVEMDADLSHDPAAVPRSFALVEAGADLAIGSRYVPGGSIPDWPWSRRALSRWGNRYALFMLGLAVDRLDVGVSRVSQRHLGGHRLHDHPSDRVRVPDRARVPGREDRWSDGRGAHRLHRPDPGPFEDVAEDRARVDAARHLVGHHQALLVTPATRLPLNQPSQPTSGATVRQPQRGP